MDITTAEVAIVSDPKRNDGKPSPNFVINFNNSGNSPARKFSWYFLVIYLWPKEKLLRGEKTFPPDNWTKDIAANKPLSINSHMLNGSLNDEENAIFGAKALHIIVTVVYRFIDVFDEPIIAEQNFAGQFASGTLGQFIELHRWPSSAEEMHIMFNKSKVAESTKPDQPNRQ